MNRRRFMSLAVGAFVSSSACQGSKPQVVLYCAQDREFAVSVLADFTAKTGIEVLAKYDTEADKSVSLVEELTREKDRPRCDVHWNNEIVGTIRLSRRGVLKTYSPAAAEPFPDWAKRPNFTAFASRARVLIVNTKLVAESEYPKSLLDLVQPKWRGRVAMAKPLFGTTATHAACLFEAIGSVRAKQYFTEMKANEMQIVAGNKQSALAVARGDAAIGLTDTDDAVIELESGRPVAIIYPDHEKNSAQPKLGTLFIPNTVAIIERGPNAEPAQQLVEFLLSPEIERKLASTSSRQIPVNPVAKAELPSSILRPSQVQVMSVDFEKAVDRWDETQSFLRNLFATG